MTQDLMDYPKLVEQAMRQVMRAALERAAAEGLPGAHHFYIGFRTGDEGVDIGDRLAAQYPDEMTIVIENKFWGLEVSDAGFAVTLSFGGASERLTVPFDAVTSFVDPSVPFGLRFGVDAAATVAESGDAPRDADDGPQQADDAPQSDSGVVALDQFRRK